MLVCMGCNSCHGNVNVRLQSSMFIKILFLVCPIYLGSSVDGEHVRVIEDVVLRIANGEIIGQRVQTTEDKIIEQFLSIPYAKAPVEDLRFKRSVPIEPWLSPLNTSGLPHSCMQVPGQELIEDVSNVIESEDCLYLSVYKPVGLMGLLPVLVWIHGGGFIGGSISVPGNIPDYLVGSHGIIAVALQYRVGSLGFLYLNHEDAPGNMGLLDQQLALKWVKHNIKTFGGDPNQITLMGESAGAGSVSHHLISPGSQGLFNRAIIQSGSAISSWAYNEPQNLIPMAEQLVLAMSCEGETTAEAMNCLRSVDADKIMQAEKSLQSTGVRFTPTNDNYFLNHTTKHYLDNSLFSRVPVLGGITRHEGDFFLLTSMPKLVKPTPPSITNDVLFNILGRINTELDDEVKKYVDLYHSVMSVERGVPATNLDVLREIYGNAVINCDAIYSLYKYANHQPERTFMYVLDYKVAGTDMPPWIGAFHGIDLPIIFGHHITKGRCLSTEDQIVRKKVVSYWINFIKHGDPNKCENGCVPGVNWKPVGSGQTRTYLLINGDETWKHYSNFNEKLCVDDFSNIAFLSSKASTFSLSLLSLSAYIAHLSMAF